MRVLVTGGAGFIGSHIVEAYREAGHEVVVVDSLWSRGGGRRANVPAEVRFYDVDITSSSLADVFERERPEIVNHQAAQHSVKISTESPEFDAQVNVLGLLNILELSRQYEVRKVIFASSGATYGTPVSVPMNEDTPQRPESPYGITKMMAEHYLRYYRDAFGLDYTAFRYGNVYGPRQDPSGEAGVIAIFAHRLLTGQPIEIHWDGEQAKDYVYVKDVARASVLALRHGSGRIYCLGTGVGTSVNELYARLTTIIGRKTGIIRKPKRAGDVHLAHFDCARARDELHWTPAYGLDEGLPATVAFFKRQVPADLLVGQPVAESAHTSNVDA